MYIRKASDSDLNNILSVLHKRFGHGKEVGMVKALLVDPNAKPILSLIAFKDQQAVGYILFTKAHLTKRKETTVISILAPLAIVPNTQQGIGGKLIESGLQILSDSGVDLVFVLGDPDYYSRYGFCPAANIGFSAPYPIPDDYQAAWMVQALYPGVMGTVSGKVICSDELNKAEYWQKNSYSSI
jgi:putative acetyltransferase